MSDLVRAGRRTSFATSFASGLAGQLAALVLSIPASVIVARFLGPEGKGSVDLVMLVASLASLVGGLSLSAAGPYLAGRDRYPMPELYASLGGLWLALAAVITILFAAAYWTGFAAWAAPGLPPELMLVAMLLIVLGVGRQILGSLVLGLQDFIGYNAIGVVQAAIQLAAVAVLVAALEGGTHGAITAGVLAQGGSLVAVIVVLTHRAGWPGRFSLAPIREAIPFALKSHVGNLVQALNYRLDVLLIAAIRDLEQVALYTIAVGLAELLWYVGGASALVVFPRTAASPEEAHALTPIVFRFTALLTLIGAVGLALVAGPLILAVYGDAFEGSIVPLLILLPAAVVHGAAKVLGADLLGRGHPEYNTMAAILTLGVTVVFDLLLIGPYGASGAAAACIVAYWVSFAYTLLAYRHVTGIPIGELLRPRASDLSSALATLGRMVPSRAPKV